MTIISDKPGRIFAITIFAPTLFYSSVKIYTCDILISNILLGFSISLFIYELFWILTKPYEVRNLNFNNNFLRKIDLNII